MNFLLVVLSLMGTRPEVIKMSPVIRQLELHRDRARSVVCVTGQHRELLEQGLSVFDIRPDFDLKIMEQDQTLSRLTSNLFARLDPVVEQVEPDWVLAQGDTTTVLVGALVSYYHKIHFGHVEAGLRTGDKYRPFPEEVNRRIADQLADSLFAPTEGNRQDLLREGVPDSKILVTGNTVVDALLTASSLPYDWAKGPLASLPKGGKIVLVTAHRRESFGKPLREICLAIKELSAQFGSSSVQFVYPVHLNPNVRQPVREILGGLSNVSLVEPLDYLSMVNIMKQSTLILTDSGGIQEEAPSFGVPVLVMREATERKEAQEAGVARLVGTNRQRIVEETGRLLRNPSEYSAMANKKNPFGDGKAASRIVSYLIEHAKENSA
jgi:UDP-N-acetylglucosamine 2-epimerase (non-hydrolysing)